MVMSDFAINLDFYCQPVEALGLKSQTLQALKDADLPFIKGCQFRTVRDMLYSVGLTTENGFEDIPKIGKKRAKEISDRCREHGVKPEPDGLDHLLMSVLGYYSEHQAHLLAYPVVGEVREMVFDVLDQSINDLRVREEVYRCFGIGRPRESFDSIAKSYNNGRSRQDVNDSISRVINNLTHNQYYWRVLSFTLKSPRSLYRKTLSSALR